MVSARKVILRGQSRQIPVMFTLLHQTFSLVVAVVMALAAAVIPSWSVQVGATSATSAPPALLKMAEAERAFSKRASDATPRDAFIEFFADESVSFQPEPGSARERLRKQAGAAARHSSVSVGAADRRHRGQRRPGVSHWARALPATRRQHPARLLLLGVEEAGRRDLQGDPRHRDPAARRSALRARLRAIPGSGVGQAGLDPHGGRAHPARCRQQAFSAALASKGAAEAFRSVLHSGARLHRNGTLPLTSRDAAVAWLTSNVKAMTSEPIKSETGASGDLGYTWGKAVVTGHDGKATPGYYVRVWTLGAGSRWQLVADITPA